MNVRTLNTTFQSLKLKNDVERHTEAEIQKEIERKYTKEETEKEW
jgi:hypothetical protein